MKSSKSIYYILLIITLSSCVITIEIEDNGKQKHLVVDAIITDNSYPQFIRLTRSTTDINSDMEYSPVTNALITISDQFGNVDTFLTENYRWGDFDYLDSIGYYTIVENASNEVDTVIIDDPVYFDFKAELGFYHLDRFIIHEENTYTLKIEVDNEIYTSISSVKSLPIIDSISWEYNPTKDDGQDYAPVIYYYDNDSSVNYFLFEIQPQTYYRLYSAGSVWQFSVLSDEYLSGNNYGVEIINGMSTFSNSMYYYSLDQPYEIRMHAITKEVYNYFEA